MLAAIEKSKTKIPSICHFFIWLATKMWNGKLGLHGWKPCSDPSYVNTSCVRTWVQPPGQSFAAMKDICTWSQNTHGNSWGDINKFKGQLQSNNCASGLKKVLIAADSFWVPWDRTQALNPLHRALTVALSTVAVKAVSYKINVFYHQKKSSPSFACAAAFSCADLWAGNRRVKANASKPWRNLQLVIERH